MTDLEKNAIALITKSRGYKLKESGEFRKKDMPIISRWLGMAIACTLPGIITLILYKIFNTEGKSLWPIIASMAIIIVLALFVTIIMEKEPPYYVELLSSPIFFAFITFSLTCLITNILMLVTDFSFWIIAISIVIIIASAIATLIRIKRFIRNGTSASDFDEKSFNIKPGQTGAIGAVILAVSKINKGLAMAMVMIAVGGFEAFFTAETTKAIMRYYYAKKYDLWKYIQVNNNTEQDA